MDLAQKLDGLGKVVKKGTTYDFSQAREGKIRCRVRDQPEDEDAWFEYDLDELTSTGLAFDTVVLDGEEQHGMLCELWVWQIAKEHGEAA